MAEKNINSVSDALTFLSKESRDIEPCKKEAFRYMGYKSEVKSEEIELLYEKCLEMYKSSAGYKAVYRRVSVKLYGNTVDFGFCTIENESLARNLSQCDSAVVFAATAGAGVDRLIMRCEKLSVVEGMICDCIGSSAIEVWCDEVNKIAVGEEDSKPRFSPGYGGVSLEYQRDILSFLDAERKIGITLNDSLMMSPKKSVTAFIGIKAHFKEKDNEY